MNSCFYEGLVHHSRFVPVRHVFRHRLFLVYVDLSELDAIHVGSLRSARDKVLARFHRADHLGNPDVPLDTCVRDLVESHVGHRPPGPIRLLTHFRHAGLRMNPVSFYYCFDAAGQLLEALVAEVTNTPWNERHYYVLDLRDRVAGHRYHARHAKEFHVSPFLSMDLDYEWRLNAPGQSLRVAIDAIREGTRAFSAGLALRRVPIDATNQWRMRRRYPFMTAQVGLNIYWQALRLWFKRVPFIPHPRSRMQVAVRSADPPLYDEELVS